MRTFCVAALCMLSPLWALQAEQHAESKSLKPACARIVALAPSAVEILYALDLGDSVVGVSRYSEYPPAVRLKQKIGGLFDLNYEAIVALKPTLVIGLSEFRDKLPYLETLGLKTITFEHRSLQGITDSFRTAGRVCGREVEAEALAAANQARIEAVRDRVKGRARIRTMVVIGESSGDGALKSIFLSGTDGFYNEVLELAGGKNVVISPTLGISSVSAEGVIALNPDVIIEIVLANGGPALNHAEIRKSWSSIPEVAAVKNNKIFIVDQDYVSIPGPRFVKVLEDFASYLHPDA